MVGELDVVIAGQKATILFLRDHVVLRFAGYRSALAVASRLIPRPKQIGKLLALSEIGLGVQIGKRRQIELYPQPGLLVRWLTPAVREMVQAIN